MTSENCLSYNRSWTIHMFVRLTARFAQRNETCQHRLTRRSQRSSNGRAPGTGGRAAIGSSGALSLLTTHGLVVSHPLLRGAKRWDWWFVASAAQAGGLFTAQREQHGRPRVCL
jgi:hypothetical protein